ncbi:MAG: gamma-glutamyltransferase family protein [Mangrovicoccus sp.]
MRDFQLPGRSAVFATNGLCATSHPLAARTALQILDQGGNAADAAIAAAVLLGIAEPAMTGLGGDCFALIKPAGSEDVQALNGSGRAPMDLNADIMRAAGHKVMPLDTGDAVTLPGAVDGFCSLNHHYGALPLDQILAPAIHYAETGIPVAPRAAFDWAHNGHKLQGDARGHFLIGGQPPKAGEVFSAPGQAEVLRRIAKDGRAGFYEGEVAEDMCAALNAHGGRHRLEDFATTEARWGTPISGQYKGVELLEHPPNGQGATAILLANILSHFDLPDLEPFGARRTHTEAEAVKLAYDARNRIIADPDHTARLDHMLAPETARALAQLIRLNAVLPDPAPLTEAIHRDTVYLCVVDRHRMAVSLIYSIFHAFGSGIASPKFGILFQNRGAGFSLTPGHPNELRGGHRPMHTIIPAMLKRDGKVSTIFGVMGGAYQPTGHARMLTNWVDYGLGLQEALDAPRAFPEAGELRLERGYSDAVRQELSDLGHLVTEPVEPIGGAQAIALHQDGHVLEGASDPRKDGCALGS